MKVNDDFVQAWLKIPTVEGKTTYLQTAELLHPAGLNTLVEWAGTLVRHDLRQAQQLTAVCMDIAQTANIASVVPRAAYLKAQTHALSGELDTALRLAESAHSGYLANGQEQQALSTNLGLMHILAEMGQYQQALTAGQAILDRAGRRPATEILTMAAQAAQNMGLCYRRIGQYEAALNAYATAEAYYRKLKMPERIGDINNNRGVLLMEIGRVTEALTALEQALVHRAAAGQRFLQAQTMNNLGSAYLHLGDYSQSLASFEEARRLFANQENALDGYILLLDTAHAYLALNLYAEAITLYREVEQIFATRGANHHRTLALWGLGAALQAQGSLGEAAQILETTIPLLQTPATPLLATILLEQAAVQAAQGHPKTALETARRALQLAVDHGWPLPTLYAHLRLSDLLFPDPEQAERHLSAAYPLVNSLGLPQLKFRWLERYGRLRRRQGLDAEAQLLLEEAIFEIEQLRGNLPQENFRPSFLQDKMMAYDELVQLFLARGDLYSLRQAFQITEQAKSRSLVDLMSGAVQGQMVQESERRKQLQHLQANLNALYNEMLAAGTDGERHIHVTNIQEQVLQLERKISRLHLQEMVAGMRSAAGMRTDTLGGFDFPESLLNALPAGITLLSYYCLEDEVVAFVHRKGELTVRMRLCSVTEVRKLLERLIVHWGRFRVGEEFVQQHLPILIRAAEHLLGKLYDLLIAPLEPVLSDGYRLTIIPHGPLHHIPFPALFDGVDYLLERYEISYAPSTTLFLLCQDRKPRAATQTLVMGVSDHSIPAVRREVTAVACHTPEPDVNLDEAATLAVLQSQASACTHLHLACHGFFRADNPMYSAIRLYDGWLTALQVLQLDLDGAMVTLSGCDTGVNQIIQGDELLGLTRAFLGAGAASLIVSLWLVQDETTALLMSTFYAQLQQKKAGRAAALRQAQRIVKASHPHPYYWAPFILVGQRDLPANNRHSQQRN